MKYGLREPERTCLGCSNRSGLVCVADQRFPIDTRGCGCGGERWNDLKKKLSTEAVAAEISEFWEDFRSIFWNKGDENVEAEKRKAAA